MSYILDALRRADAERRHGQVPGLTSQPSPPPARVAPLQRPGTWWLGAAVLLALLVAAAAWWWAGQRAAAPAATAAAPAALPQAAPAAALPTPAPSNPPVAQPRQPAPPPLPLVVSAAPPAPTQAPPQAVPAQTRALPMASLSAEQRRELPALVLGGSVWSASAGSRFVIFNGQLVHEGEAAAPGVVVESIGPRSAVLRWRDLRIDVPF